MGESGFRRGDKVFFQGEDEKRLKSACFKEPNDLVYM